MRHLVIALLVAAVAALPAPAPAEQAAAPVPEEQVLRKCTLCHSSQRFFSADPAQIKALVERMAAKFPDWFRDADQQKLAADLARVLEDPKTVAARKEWDATVARGKALFADPSLGVGAKSCAGCHAERSLRGVVEAYPKFDARTGRLVGLQERITQMIVGQMGGKQLPLGDPRTVALEAYLKSLQ